MAETLTGAMRRAAMAAILAALRLYQLAISPLLPPSCRFTPTCSHYAMDAVRLHGPAKGLVLAARRLSRCHPIAWLGGASGFDPVPRK
jgi:putative membrane protein insertion efficiency factor